MPIEVEKIASDIYCARWVGQVTSDEFRTANESVHVQIEQDQVMQWVSMIDGTNVTSIPLDLRGYMSTPLKTLHTVLILNAPYAGELLGKLINNMTSMNVEFFRDRDAWFDRAKAIQATFASDASTH